MSVTDDSSEEPADESTDAVQRFLEMPPEHGVGDQVDAEPIVVDNRTVWQKLKQFFFMKKPSQYSSIAPRGADGKRIKPTFFNGNGRGR